MPKEINDDGGTTIQAKTDTVDTTKAEETPVVETPANDLPGDEKGKEDKADVGLPGGEEQKDDPKDEDPEGTSEEDEKLTGAPEEYGDFDISAGEETGYVISDEQTKAFTDMARDLNLTKEQAQKLLSFDIDRHKEVSTVNAKTIEDYKVDGLQASRKEHGDKFKALYSKNSQVYAKFFSEDARITLNDMGISSQPWFFNALKAFSSVLSEDVMVPSDSGANDPSKRTLEEYFK